MNRIKRGGNRFFPYVLALHATYILVTAVWPLVDIESFMDVTGPKSDVWLVKTVAALLIPVSLTLYSYLFIQDNVAPAFILGISTAIAFMAIDFYYALSDVIPDIYLLDGVAEFIFLVAWILAMIPERRTTDRPTAAR